MTPHKKGRKWEIIYRIPGYSKLFTERFDSEAEAKLRCAQIEYAKQTGTIAPPVRKEKIHPKTMGELLDEYVELYGVGHWGDSYYSLTKHRIEDYIKPAIGNLLVKDVTPRVLDALYADMLNTPAKVLPGHKDTTKTISYPVIEKCHCVIRSALNQAVRWGYIPSNPALASMVPKAPSKRRDVWTPAEAQKAISVCTDPNLKVCLLLSIGCSLRLGEILGLQWSHVHITEESLQDNSSVLEIRQELKRCDKEALRALEGKKRSNVYFTFPETKEDCKTSLVLKMPKTESSIRDIYIPNSVAKALQELQKAQEAQKKKLHGLYHDFNMVIAQPDGRPTEGRLLDKDFKSLIETHQLPPVVFHSLRHLSTSMKLQYSGGDIKAVQGDTGHAQASMVTQVYSHTFDENRRRVASLMEKSFFRQEKGKADKQDSGDEENGEDAKTEADHKDESARNQQILRLLDQSPDLADLILALASSRTDRSTPATV